MTVVCLSQNTRCDCDCSSNYGITDAVFYSNRLLQDLYLPLLLHVISSCSVEFTTASSNKEGTLQVKKKKSIFRLLHCSHCFCAADVHCVTASAVVG